MYRNCPRFKLAHNRLGQKIERIHLRTMGRLVVVFFFFLIYHYVGFQVHVDQAAVPDKLQKSTPSVHFLRFLCVAHNNERIQSRRFRHKYTLTTPANVPPKLDILYVYRVHMYLIRMYVFIWNLSVS